MGKKNSTLSELNLEGHFLGFEGDEPGKYKYLHLAIPSGNMQIEMQIKIPKELRPSLGLSLVPGEQIRVSGTSKYQRKSSKIKLKAHHINQVGFCFIQNRPPAPKAKILVCEKSGCVKRGGNDLLSELEKTLGDRHLSDQVTIEHTECQKCCKNAPNYVLQVGKAQYRNLKPEAIASLLENYFQK